MESIGFKTATGDHWHSIHHPMGVSPTAGDPQQLHGWWLGVALWLRKPLHLLRHHHHHHHEKHHHEHEKHHHHEKHHDKDHHHPIPSHLGVSENSVPLNPMVLLIIIPIKWLFHWEYTLFSSSSSSSWWKTLTNIPSHPNFHILHADPHGRSP